MSIGLAVHVGMNHVDPNAYAGWDGALEGSENDAKAMADITLKLGFKRRLLMSADATAAALLRAIRSAATALDDGDMCVITYAGHGGQLDDLDGDETDGKDETWVLYDREVLDDEIHTALTAFRPGVRVVVVSDSCHSGTVVRDFIRQVLRGSPTTRAAYTGVAPALRSRSRDGTAPSTVLRMRGAPPEVQASVLAQHGDLYRRIRASTPRALNDDVAASVLLLAGCQDNQTSMEYGGHGVFTAALLARWADGAFVGDYPDFLAAIRSDLPGTQSPNYLTVGRPWPAFVQQRPFTLAAPAGAAQNDAGATSPVEQPPVQATPGVSPLTCRIEISVGGPITTLDPTLAQAVTNAVLTAAGVHLPIDAG